MKKFDYTFREGLPGGANEVKGRVKGSVSKTGYKRNSPDVHNDFNVIPSPYITMVGVDFPVYGEDNLGNGQIMYPGNDYKFPGDFVTETPMYGDGGLTQWFAEEWVDIKTGKKCGRSGKDKNGRPYPACRPSKRVNSSTPKTASELSAAEKAEFKKKKTSGKRIDYNHKRAQEGIEVGNRFLPPAIRNMRPKEDPIYYDGIVGETTVTAPRYEGPQIRRLLPGEGDPINSNQSYLGVDKSGGLSALKAIGKGVKGLLGLRKLRGSADDAFKYVQGVEDFKSAAPKPVAAGYKRGVGNPYENMDITDDLFKGRHDYGIDYTGEIERGRLGFVRNLGRELDDIKFDANWMGPEHLRFHGTPYGRSVVEVAVPGKTHQTQLFYKSSALGNKAGSGINGSTQGMWQPYGGHATKLDVEGPIHEWFIKGDDYKSFYNSKSFKDIAGRLDDLTKEAGFDMSGQAYKYQQGGSLYKAQEGVRVDNTGGQYVVQKGDTFYGIANKLGMSKDEMRLANPGLDYNKIQVGQSLAAPGFAGPPQGVAQAQSVKPATKNDTYNFNDLLYRQAYQESKFDPNAISPLGYKGFTQIGSGIMQDYADATGDKRNDPFDPDYAIAVQKWAMDKYLNNTDWIKGSDKVKQAKALAAYNWGPGNTVKYLNAQKAKGVDIYSDDLSWIKNMPKETRGYISNILSLDAENNARWEAAFQRDTTGSKYSDYYKQKGGETLYDYVKDLGYSPTFANRKKIFADYFEDEYTGTAKQNIELLKKLKSGELNINQYAQEANVQPVREPVVKQPETPALTPPPQQQEVEQQNVQAQEPVLKSSYRGDNVITTDDELSEVRKNLVGRAYDVVEGKSQPYRLPSLIANAPSMQGKNPDNYTCIGGVCYLMKEEGILDEVITSNTEFARTAPNSGFSRKSSQLSNLKPGDVIQHYGKRNAEGTPIPSHAQMFLGLDDEGNYLFFDNFEKTSSSGTPDGKKDALRKYSPKKVKSIIDKGVAGEFNGAFLYHLNKEDAFDEEEQIKRTRSRSNKAKRLPGEANIDSYTNSFSEYKDEVMASQDVPYIWRSSKDANQFEKELVGLFNDSEMDETLKDTLGWTEQTVNEVKPIIYGIMKQESNMGEGADYQITDNFPKFLGKTLRKAKYNTESSLTPALPEGAPVLGGNSYGPGSIRWSGLDSRTRQAIGKKKDVNTPRGAYLAVANMLKNSANQAERYVGEDINEDLLDQNPWFPALYAYNGQMLGKEKNFLGITKNVRGKTWGMVTGKNKADQRYSADAGSYPDKIMNAAQSLQQFVPIDYEPSVENYYNPAFVATVRPKTK